MVILLIEKSFKSNSFNRKTRIEYMFFDKRLFKNTFFSKFKQFHSKEDRFVSNPGLFAKYVCRMLAPILKFIICPFWNSFHSVNMIFSSVEIFGQSRLFFIKKPKNMTFFQIKMWNGISFFYLNTCWQFWCLGLTPSPKKVIKWDIKISCQMSQSIWSNSLKWGQNGPNIWQVKVFDECLDVLYQNF